MPYTYQFPHPSVTADCVVFARKEGRLHVLLVKRGREPFKNCWAFPGGFLEEDETIETCARRELMEETGLMVDTLRQFKVYSDPLRDTSRESRVITVAFTAEIVMAEVSGQDDAAEARWWPIDALPPLAFDHGMILAEVLKKTPIQE